MSSSLKLSIIVAIISGIAGLLLLLQEVIIASHFGVSEAADAYQLAINFPLLAVNVFAGGTLLAVLVPLFVQYSVAGRTAELFGMVKWIRRAIGGLLLVVCALWALIYPNIIDLVAKGFSPASLSLSVYLLWLLVPVLFFAGMAGIEAAVLNSRRRFIFTSTLPAFMPAGVILSVLLFEGQLGIYAAAIGLLFGSVMQWLTSRCLSAHFFSLYDHSAVPNSAPTNLVQNYTASAISAALLAGILLTDTFMAATLQTGSAAAYGYAVRPVILFLAFVTVAVANVALPFFSHMVANEDWAALKRNALTCLGLLAVGSLPFVALWYAYVAEIVALLYQRGAFDVYDTFRVAEVQQIYLIQIPFYLAGMIGWRVMNSLNQHKALLVITALCFFTNMMVDLWLLPRLGLLGIAWGTNIAFALWAILITLYLSIQHNAQQLLRLGTKKHCS